MYIHGKGREGGRTRGREQGRVVYHKVSGGTRGARRECEGDVVIIKHLV